ncbi:hypothetical protein DEJ28_02660 [Curtobacterium sp. MCPF17_002]|uniref:hypothetical protein n=1 Tax=Curtobacterium sp. MCPF17_002 TaxID=2175645 RepID=UPI000DA6E42F|nr:hypothetical protein [Curtobacterium sp. MCPF17_002]WIB78018.1 hypothetical protein DEJ28_02660 [Curtobacterium sp. MCPF17_002]
MTDRGNTTHRPELDEQLAHEAQSIVQGHGSNSHVEEFRQSEPDPDDTDDAETVTASGYDGEVEGALKDDSAGGLFDQTDGDVPEPDADGTVYTTETTEEAGRGADDE